MYPITAVTKSVKSMRNIFHHQAIIKTAIEHSIICVGAINKPREREREREREESLSRLYG